MLTQKLRVLTDNLNLLVELLEMILLCKMWFEFCSQAEAALRTLRFSKQHLIALEL